MPADSQSSLARAAGGDPSAFGELIDPLTPRLLLLVRARGAALVGGDCGAEDVVQAALLKAWQLLPGFEDRGPDSLYRWLVALARGVLSDRGKYLAAKGRGDVAPQGEREPFDPATSITKLAARREAFDRALAALSELEPGQREVVERHLLEGQTLSEIAAALGVTKNAVWERLHRGTDRLRSLLGGDAPW